MVLNFMKKLSTGKKKDNTEKSVGLESMWITLAFCVNANSFSETIQDIAE